MTQIDIALVGELLRSEGARLYVESKNEVHLPSREALLTRFHQINKQTAIAIKETLAQSYPSIHWSNAEFEIQNQQNAEFEEYWICDAVDGALHFLQGFAFYAISLCLIRGGKPVVSFVYDPCSQELFHAVAGAGAFLNGELIQTSQKVELIDAFLTTSLPSNPAEDVEAAELTVRGIGQLMSKVLAVKMLGSVSLQLAYVASGRLDGYWEFGNDYYDWLAGSLLVQEAGGVVSDSQGKPFTWGTSGIIAANKQLIDKLSAELNA